MSCRLIVLVQWDVAVVVTEVVGSLGRPKADRSVQYKYLNPHLIAVITQSLDQAKREHENRRISSLSASYHIVVSFHCSLSLYFSLSHFVYS